MAQAKDNYYWTQLCSALTAGQWESSNPAKAPNGTHLSWSELFRKFRKHCGKNEVVAEAASQTQSLSLLLCRKGLTSKDLDGEDDESPNPFQLWNECILFEERMEEAQRCYETLQTRLENSNNDSLRLALAYFAYALDRPSDCLAHLIDVSFSDDIARVRPSGLNSVSAALTANVALSVNSALSISGASNGVLSRTASITQTSLDFPDRKASMYTEAIRSFCLQGMSHERLSPESMSTAISYYERGVTLLSSLSIPKSLPNRSGKANFDTFMRYRELWRWSERLLRRAIILSSCHRSIETTMPLFYVYRSHSEHWPATFRSLHRSIVSSLNLRTLILLSGNPRPQFFRNRSAWTNEARSVIHEYRAVLGATSYFPRSGERNVAVEEFVDYCVAVWEAGGAVGDQAGWVIDILWWATRLTFHSQRIIRHMTRLLHASGEHDLAKRMLRLYVQITEKAREASVDGVNNADAVDSDRQWVETLVQGARMLCRLPDGVKEAREAAQLIEHARTRLDKSDEKLVANVELADGICKAVLAIRDQEPSTREPLSTESLALLSRSIATHPTASAYFHAALGFSRSGLERNLVQAIIYARKAVEEESKELRYWHLLALLQAKTGEWKKARGVLEVALEIADDMEEEALDDEVKANGVNGVSVRDFGTTDGDSAALLTSTAPSVSDALPNPISPTVLLSKNDSLPPAATLLSPLPDHPPPSQRELFEHALQLRMSDLALTELVEGPESVRDKWLEVFAWYADRRDISSAARSARPSTDGRLSMIHPSPQIVPLATMPPGEASQHNSIAIGEQISDPSLLMPPPALLMPPPALSIQVIQPSPEIDTEKGRSSPMLSMPTPVGEKEKSSPQSPLRERDTSKGKKVQKMLKDGVHKGQARINTISKKIGNGVVRGSSSVSLHRSKSAPDIHAVLARAGTYQASSIHSRKRVISWGSRSNADQDAPSPIPSPPPPPPSLPFPQDDQLNRRSARERRLLSDLWLTSAATFRRLGKIEQARAAIQEAEVLDEENEAVWVQLGLYFSALGNEGKAIEAFHKALFISPDNCAAIVHLCRLYLSPHSSSPTAHGTVDLASGMLENLTRGVGWDVPEAWYLLAKAYGMQCRKQSERDCLAFALGLVETRGVRDIGVALGWCL